MHSRVLLSTENCLSISGGSSGVDDFLGSTRDAPCGVASIDNNAALIDDQLIVDVRVVRRDQNEIGIAKRPFIQWNR